MAPFPGGSKYSEVHITISLLTLPYHPSAQLCSQYLAAIAARIGRRATFDEDQPFPCRLWNVSSNPIYSSALPSLPQETSPALACTRDIIPLKIRCAGAALDRYGNLLHRRTRAYKQSSSPTITLYPLRSSSRPSTRRCGARCSRCRGSTPSVSSSR